MDTATWFINHSPSDSRTAVSFAVQNKRIRLIEVTSIKGNVIPLKEVRACFKLAKQILLG
jgi:inosine-uridine nucleoside N-ribohydrolase